MSNRRGTTAPALSLVLFTLTLGRLALSAQNPKSSTDLNSDNSGGNGGLGGGLLLFSDSSDDPLSLANLTVINSKNEKANKFQSKCGRSCGNGICDEQSGECDCFPGWNGRECHLCGGKIRLNSTKGWLADALGNYTVDSKCTWLIESPIADSKIRLHLKEFATECGWDHLYIFDGDSVFSDLKAVYSGMVRQDRYQVQRIPEVVGDSGYMLIHFYSDVAYNMTGFNVTFSVDSCPSERHDLTCSGHGTCDSDSGRCVCDEDFKGPACSAPACPKNCAPKGQCNRREKRCECYSGWAGDACEQSPSQGFWQVLNTDYYEEAIEEEASSVDGKALPFPRTSHAAVVDEFGKMWVVGGETFTTHSHHMVSTFTLDAQVSDESGGHQQRITGKWEEVHANSRKGPSDRYGHSAVIHERKIYMYGGTMRSGHVSKELWALDLDLKTWDRVESDQGQCMVNGQNKVCGPLQSVGHTATVVSNRMIVIFGHSPKYGYLDTVQEYHFGNNEWSIVPTTGYPVKGGFGHSAVHDEITNRIFVYGGYVSLYSTSASISNDLYALDPIQRKWTLMTKSSHFRYLHSAVISNGLMIVYGGNTHNDTSFSYGAKCFSSDIMVYDILCDRWDTMTDSLPKDDLEASVDLARFGHTAVIARNGTMLIHGGFHGILKRDLLAFTPGDCEMFKTRGECLTTATKIGAKCIWETKSDLCIKHPGASFIGGTNLKVKPPSYDFCFRDLEKRNDTGLCADQKSCSACVSTSADCVWCEDHCQWRTCSASMAMLSSSSGGKIKTINNALTFKTKTINKLEECVNLDTGVDAYAKELCAHIHSCHLCRAKEGCQWEVDTVSKCREAKSRKNQGGGNLTDNKDDPEMCSVACNERTTCGNCTRSLCMWCKNLNMCIDRNAYLAAFPYGQCMEWTTQTPECPLQLGNDSYPADICSGYKTCDSCRSNPSCGWCDDGSLTGVGSCHLGGAKGPMTRESAGLHGGHYYEWVLDERVCRMGDGKSWHFTDCPSCQCNGHSKCTSEEKGGEGICDKPCEDYTAGERCEICDDGFFGDPVNGGSCQSCQCNGQASSCHHESGKCHCTTKGIIGDHCDVCDKVNHYYGDPIKDSCFYDLAIDYQFTFNLSKSDDKHFTAINFRNTPTKVDVDVDFSIQCSVPAKMNLTYRYNVVYDRNPDKVEKEEVLFSNINCTALKERFLKDNYKFGRLANTTFYVYVYDFEPPLWIIISFSQHPKLDLLQFFITFSSCFLALLLTAAILWKIKQRYDRYRRRQRLFVEMEQMASRPFGSVIVDLERMSSIASSSSSKAKRGEISSTVDGASGVLPQTSTNLTGDIACTTKAAAEVVVSTSTSIAGSLSEEGAKANLATASQQQSHSTVSQQQSSSSSGGNRKRKRIKYRPSPIALEPCDGNRAAVLTLIVRLPTGGRTYAPAGYSGIAIASALVTLSNPRKSSGEGGTGSKNNDDPKRSKGRNKDRSQSSSRDNANNPGGGGGGNNPSSGNSGGVAIATTDM